MAENPGAADHDFGDARMHHRTEVAQGWWYGCGGHFGPLGVGVDRVKVAAWSMCRVVVRKGLGDEVRGPTRPELQDYAGAQRPNRTVQNMEEEIVRAKCAERALLLDDRDFAQGSHGAESGGAQGLLNPREEFAQAGNVTPLPRLSLSRLCA